jgi:hypothetical protein
MDEATLRSLLEALVVPSDNAAVRLARGRALRAHPTLEDRDLEEP